MNWRCWFRHSWKWNGRKRTYPGNPLPHFPMQCERCGKSIETTQPEKYIREVKR